MDPLQCELFFLMRVHGKGTDKTVTVRKEQDHTHHELLPLFGNEAYHALLHRTFRAPETIEVPVAGAAPVPQDYFAAAQVEVKEQLGSDYDLSNALAINSRWNGQSKTWDIIPGAAGADAFGYVITDADTAVPIETTIALGDQTLFVDFVVMVQGVQP